MLATFAVLLAAVQMPPCAAVPPPAVQFTPGEQLKFRLDLLGADVGTFDVSLERAPASEGAALAVRARARTSAFIATNLGRYEVFAVSLLGKDLRPVKYREEVDEGPTHKTIEVRFPPSGGKLPISATKDGNPDPVDLEAGPTARDMLSTLYLLRGQVPGRPVCADVYSGRKVWRLTGTIAQGEEIETPLGKFKTLRFDGTSTRLDDTNVTRSAHVWVSDDDRRLPLVALGEVKGKTLRAQLVEATGASARAAAPQRKGPATREPPRVGAAIGR
ncbi:MAG: DUF3108 domain-containing protein [Deltaproteobacteria bacterium]|nr:MAG: DUF3108 domain-containing protein [Deltaproteobacteria bacterium]TMB28596.1 MAG: DUF3108 domain-containing protein [Deltaproteobacteria bacterium]